MNAPDIDEWLKRVFTMEVRQQCTFALIALHDAQEVESASLGAIQGRTEDPDHVMDATRFWYSVQAFLGACANISKLCWPGKGKKTGESEADWSFRVHRGELLKDALGLDDASPLKSRTLRNSFEHMDERLDLWARTSQRRYLISRSIGTPCGIVFEPPLGPNDTVGYYDRAADTVTFQSDPIPLTPMVQAVRRLAALLQAPR